MADFKVCSRVWIKKDGVNYLGKGRVELLRQIHKEGSILKGAKKMYMSYKAAWDNLNHIKDLGGVPLVSSNSGGRGGGGTSLTSEGERAIEVFTKLEALKEEFFAQFDECKDLDALDCKIEVLLQQLRAKDH
ncbi:hypothetical protein BBW65_00435 [Helicobacter enhydrae]|uniref:HTH lysR-type domain-containing protein n=1 Tax=Helicobacter enhydrae TaxID=222136 RepID=A0A1B1U3Q2_9HELI|nr:LysR family transcriptional regulator [Helicobacter enhydrae]ANV97378.1 hypothetical protein BBW65_00435 [Helicobacter enhydrae]